MKDALLRIVGSMKFWTAVVGLGAFLLAKYGVQVDNETRLAILGFFGVLIGGQALTDHGKAAAQIHARSMNDPPVPLPTDPKEPL